MADSHGHDAAHGPNVGTYMAVFAALSVFTAISFLINHYFPVGDMRGAVMIMGVACLGAVLYWVPIGFHAPEAADLFWPVPEFSLTERDGSSFSRADLPGKVWVVSFVFTRCSGPCPLVSATMARLQNDFADQS